MSVSTRTRWFIRGCALVGFLASLVHTFQSLTWAKGAPSPMWPPFLLLGVLAALAGIALLYAFGQRDNEGYWKLGVVFALMGLAGIPLLLLLGAMTEVWGPPVEQKSTFLRSLLGLLVDSPVMPLSALTAAGGLLVLGGVILASGVGLPRWCGPLIMLANPPVVSFLYLVFLFFVGELFVAVGIVWALVGVAWALVGVALFLRAGADRPYRSALPRRRLTEEHPPTRSSVLPRNRRRGLLIAVGFLVVLVLGFVGAGWGIKELTPFGCSSQERAILEEFPHYGDRHFEPFSGESSCIVRYATDASRDEVLTYYDEQLREEGFEYWPREEMRFWGSDPKTKDKAGGEQPSDLPQGMAGLVACRGGYEYSVEYNPPPKLGGKGEYGEPDPRFSPGGERVSDEEATVGVNVSDDPYGRCAS